MLEATFIHLPGVGQCTERRLWDSGIQTWTAALRSRHAPGISQARWAALQREIEQCVISLRAQEHRHFSRCLPTRYHWRAWPDFPRRVAYLDIETTGTEPWAQVTVVGVYDGHRVHTFVHGDNLDQFPDFIDQFAILVTFNGTTFDIPFLLRRFRKLEIHHLHVDLRYALRQTGLAGPLKTIERRLGLVRDADIAHLTGFDAVRLWQKYCHGSEKALEVLRRYNAADVTNLEPLAEYAYRELWKRCRGVCNLHTR